MPAISKSYFKQLIKAFQFKTLFIEELGWDNPKQPQATPIATANDKVFELKPIAEKSGFKILLCGQDEKGLIPEYSTRRQIDVQATRLFQEHIIIYTDHAKTRQIWQVPVHKANQPTRLVETTWLNHQDPELLYQRASGMFFDFDDEGYITIVDVVQKVNTNFASNAEKVTKTFYEKFRKEHQSFYKFIEGIDDHLDNLTGKEKTANRNKEWYTSLMLNRLMFCYFIQRKGFLNNDLNYLENQLKKSIERQGKDQFYSFYRSFLLRLFHQVLNAPKHDELINEFGKIPYLNGGLFDEHDIERNFPDIQISDEAFKQLFKFFGEWE